MKDQQAKVSKKLTIEGQRIAIVMYIIYTSVSISVFYIDISISKGYRNLKRH